MLTVRGVFDDGHVTFLDEVPITGKHEVLVTFLTADDGIVLLRKERAAELLRLVREGDVLLTTRERQVLRLAQRGVTVEEIAAELQISKGTARNYLSAIYSKLKVRNRAEALKRAVEMGIIDPISGPFT